MLGQLGAVALLGLCSLMVSISAEELPDQLPQGYDQETSELLDALSQMHQQPSRFYDDYAHMAEKRDIESAMPGVLRFGKRAQSFIRFGRSDSEMQKKEMPGVLRFGKRSENQEKKSVPGVLRFGKRSDMPGVLRFGKRSDIPGVLRFGKKSVPGVLRFGRK